MLDLLTPYIAPQHAHMVKPAQEQWNAIPLQRQRQIYVTLWEQKLRGIAIKSSVLRHQRLRAYAVQLERNGAHKFDDEAF